MAQLDRNDPIGIADAIADAGATTAAAFFPSFFRVLPSQRAVAHDAQEARLALAEDHAVNRAHRLSRLQRSRSREESKAIEADIAAHYAQYQRHRDTILAREADAKVRLETEGACVINAVEWLLPLLRQERRLLDIEPPRPTVLPAGLGATLKAKRAELDVIAVQREQVEQVKASADQLRAAISRAVADEAIKGRPPFDPRIRGGRDPSRFAEQLEVRATNSNILSVGVGGVPFLVWLLADHIEARLHAMVDEADLTGAMSDAEQAAALAALDAQRLAIEREEEALIRMAEAQGMTIARRADASPEAVMMVKVIE